MALVTAVVAMSLSCGFSDDDSPARVSEVQSGPFQRVAHVFGGHLVAHGHIAIEKVVQEPVEIPDGQCILETGQIGNLGRPRAQVLHRVVEACDLVQA